VIRIVVVVQPSLGWYRIVNRVMKEWK